MARLSCLCNWRSSGGILSASEWRACFLRPNLFEIIFMLVHWDTLFIFFSYFLKELSFLSHFHGLCHQTFFCELILRPLLNSIKQLRGFFFGSFMILLLVLHGLKRLAIVRCFDFIYFYFFVSLIGYIIEHLSWTSEEFWLFV